MNNQTTFVVLLIVLGALLENYTEACSCHYTHPQEQFCQSDFVILARIRKEIHSNDQKIYKAKIRKEFKMSEKARLALKSGRLQTAMEGSMCGVNLEPGKLYLITGRVMGLQAHVSLCGYTQLWKNVLPRQRKGFRLLYGKGCGCKISSYLYSHTPTLKDRCIWSERSCQSDHGICLRSPTGQCHWSKSLHLRKCLKGEYIPPIRKLNEPHKTRVDDKQVKQETPLREEFSVPLKEKSTDFNRENNMATNRIQYQHYRAKRDIATS